MEAVIQHDKCIKLHYATSVPKKAAANECEDSLKCWVKSWRNTKFLRKYENYYQ